MNAAEVLIDFVGRIEGEVHRVLDGLSSEELNYRPDPQANTISWLIWHLTRVQDDHIAAVADLEQVWTAQGWYERFELPFPPAAHGYGQNPDEVAKVTADVDLLLGYYDAVHEQSLTFLKGLTDTDLDRIVDDAWDPPVTLGVRLISVLSDDLQHIGHAAYVLGLATRR